ncbi:MAG: transposase [Cytophagaceae bacterium]|nr:transposase [Cytophagaceae bacterium]
MNLKGWLRGIHHTISPAHVQGYRDEFCYRFNNRYSKKPAWESLVTLMLIHVPVIAKNLYEGNESANPNCF